jgi:hypothetical protein
MSTIRNTSIFCLFILFVLSVPVSPLFASGEEFWLNSDYSANPAVKFGFNRAGYSDECDWGESNRHNWLGAPHELLCGEFAAAIYFDGIQNNCPNWLTDRFK